MAKEFVSILVPSQLTTFVQASAVGTEYPESYILAPTNLIDDPTETLAISLATVILPAVKFMVVADPTSVPADWIPILLIPPPAAAHDPSPLKNVELSAVPLEASLAAVTIPVSSPPGKLVKSAPEPLKPVAVNIPVDGLYINPLSVSSASDEVVPSTNTGYTVSLVVLLFAINENNDKVAVVALVALPLNVWALTIPLLP